MKLKRMYNKWLFKKYGFEREPFFEKIPTIYKVFPLFSPSLYGHFECNQVADWFREGIESGMKD